VIVRFLALLELYKQGLIDLAQAGSFGTHEIQWTSDATAVAGPVDTYDG
jgi:chromatin segregation and condensation protein Rec8/ScpA/Scc1 (kleisin family)